MSKLPHDVNRGLVLFQTVSVRTEAGAPATLTTTYGSELPRLPSARLPSPAHDSSGNKIVASWTARRGGSSHARAHVKVTVPCVSNEVVAVPMRRSIVISASPEETWVGNNTVPISPQGTVLTLAL